MSVGKLRVLVLISLVGLIMGLAMPKAAPQAMTMGTMDAMMGVDRYQDVGRCGFWVVNMSNPADRIEREFDCGFYWDWSKRDAAGAYIHEALLDHETGEVFTVPHMEKGTMEEWYHVEGAMLTDDALTFTRVDGAGVLMPPPGASGNLTMGWVESGGEKGGEERLVHARNLSEVGTKTIRGIETVHWTSSFTSEPATWHGYDVRLSEEVDLWSDPQTGWILEMRRHVVVEMTPSQMAAAKGYDAPTAPGPAGDARPVMELTYRTVPAGTNQHAEQDETFRAMMTPIGEGDRIALASLLGLVVVGGYAVYRTTGDRWRH